MSIYGFRLRPFDSFENARYNLRPVAFILGTFLLEKLYYRSLSLSIPDYQIGFIKARKVVSIGFAAYTTLKIMELAKLIPSVPLPFKIIGALSTFALATSGLAKAMYSLKTANDLAQRFSAMQKHCLSLKEKGLPFHCSIELINPQDSKPYLIHVIYKPQKEEKIKLFYINDRHHVLPDTYLIISPFKVDPSTEKLITEYLNEVFNLDQEGMLTITDLDIKSVVVNEQILERTPF